MVTNFVVAHVKTPEPYVAKSIRDRADVFDTSICRTYAKRLLEWKLQPLNEALSYKHTTAETAVDHAASRYGVCVIDTARTLQRTLLSDPDVMSQMYEQYQAMDKNSMKPVTVKYTRYFANRTQKYHDKITFPNVQFINFMFGMELFKGEALSWNQAAQYIDKIHMRHEWQSFLYLNRNLYDFTYESMVDSAIEAQL